MPLLSKVPLLGAAFRQSRVQRDKTNLLIFLTPHVITTDADVQRVTRHKKAQAHDGPDCRRSGKERDA